MHFLILDSNLNGSFKQEYYSSITRIQILSKNSSEIMNSLGD